MSSFSKSTTFTIYIFDSGGASRPPSSTRMESDTQESIALLKKPIKKLSTVSTWHQLAHTVLRSLSDLVEFDLKIQVDYRNNGRLMPLGAAYAKQKD